MIRRIEELTLTAWPALQNMYYDGWILRFSEGYTKRANSVQPIYPSFEAVDEKIRICEEIYDSNSLDVVFKITPDIFPKNLDEILTEKGYKKVAPTSVQILDLDNAQNGCLKNIDSESYVTEEWMNEFYRLSNKNTATKFIHTRMLQNILSNSFFASISLEGHTIACGLGVLESDFIGLFDIIVDKQYRNMGYGKLLVLGLIQLGKNNGAKQAYLQVVKDNAPALKLYSKIGFKEVYEYWYRVKSN